ncbi:MAG: hypothetical protein ABIK28_16035 [Planctomycetota bacterium]
MSSAIGIKQVVQQATADSISFRLLDLDSGEEIIISSITSLKWYDPDGAAITHGGTPSKSGSEATIALTFAAVTYVVGTHKLVWTFADAVSAVHVRTQFVQVALRIFQSQLDNDDVILAHPGITLAAGITWTRYRNRAWRRIESFVRKSLKADPSLLFFPERFFDAHIAWTLAEFFRTNALSGGAEEDWTKFREFEREGLALIKEVLSHIDYDADGDGLLGDEDSGHNVLPWSEREFM